MNKYLVLAVLVIIVLSTLLYLEKSKVENIENATQNKNNLLNKLSADLGNFASENITDLTSLILK